MQGTGAGGGKKKEGKQWSLVSITQAGFKAILADNNTQHHRNCSPGLSRQPRHNLPRQNEEEPTGAAAPSPWWIGLRPRMAPKQGRDKAHLHPWRRKHWQTVMYMQVSWLKHPNTPSSCIHCRRELLSQWVEGQARVVLRLAHHRGSGRTPDKNQDFDKSSDGLKRGGETRTTSFHIDQSVRSPCLEADRLRRSLD